MRQANRDGFSLVLVVGRDEMNRAAAKLKDMATGGEELLARDDVVNVVGKRLLQPLSKVKDDL